MYPRMGLPYGSFRDFAEQLHVWGAVDAESEALDRRVRDAVEPAVLVRLRQQTYREAIEVFEVLHRGFGVRHDDADVMQLSESEIDVG